MMVADGEQVLAVAAGECPDAILPDINLPGADGFTVTASLAAVCPGVRNVVTSAEVDRASASVLRTCAAVAFVPRRNWAVTDLGTLFAA